MEKHGGKESPMDMLPTIKVSELPSGFKTYKENARISYRTYSFGELRKLNQSTMHEFEKIKFIFSGIKCNFDRYELTVPDFLYIAFLRRISTYGETGYMMPVRCEICDDNHLFNHHFNDTDIQFDDLNVPKLPATATLADGQELAFKPLLMREYIKRVNDGKSADDLALLSSMVSNMEYDEAYRILTSLTDPVDIEVVEEIDRMLNHGLVPLDATCPKCKKYKTKLFLEMSIDEVLPQDRHKGAVEARIRYGD